MTVEIVRSVLAWSSVINIGLLLWWSLFIMFAGDWVYQMHGKLFKIPAEKFATIHYTGIAIYKLAIILFNVAPYLALRIVG